MILEADRAAALDENARAFVKTFVEHVTTITGDDRGRSAVVARVNVLLLAALAGGDGATSAWHLLHRTIVRIVENEHAARNTGGAYAYLLSFVSENGDLAHD
jgi:hypothetical protein